MGICHRQYNGKAFYIRNDEIVSRHIDGKIMVDAICFQQMNPDYPCAWVQKMRRVSEISWFILSGGDEDRTEAKYVDVDLKKLEEHEYLICSPTVLGFSFDDKSFCEQDCSVGSVNY